MSIIGKSDWMFSLGKTAGKKWGPKTLAMLAVLAM
jgi:hypothetical protein